MKTGSIKRVTAVCFAAMMAAMSVVGCGGSTSSSSANNGNSSNGSYKDYSNGFDHKVTIKIPVYDRAFEGWDVTNNYYTKWVQKEFGDKYNIDVQYVAIGRTTEVADYEQMIAAGTAPDIIIHYDMPQAENYYSEGAMQDLDLNEVAYYAPTYYANMKDTIEKYGKLDGKNAFVFGNRTPIYYNWVNLIRQDWLDKVNMQMPTTEAELEKVLQAWKDAGLGNGGGNLSLQITNSFTGEYSYIGANAPSAEDEATYLDLNVAPLTWEPTKKYLATMNRQYNAGLIDPEFYLNEKDTDTKADFVSGKSGIYGMYMSSSTDVISSLLANDPNAKVACMNPGALAEDGKAYYYDYPPFGLIMGINSKTTDEQRAAVWMYLNWLSQPDNLFYFQNGVEGQNYTMEDGIAVPIAGYSGESKLSKNNNVDYWCLIDATARYDTEEKTYKASLRTLAPTGYEYLIEDSYKYCKANEKYAIMTPIFTKPVESTAEYSSDLKAMWKEYYVDLVTCPTDQFEAKYQKDCKEFLDGGYQKILDEKQGLIKAGSYIK